MAMANLNEDLIDNLFYNIMMNIEDNIIAFQENNQNQLTSNSIINQSLYESNPIKMVISEEEKGKLATIKYKDAINKQQNTACFITQDDFQENDDIIQLPCNHCFMPDSIMHWLAEECAECPVCRYKFDSVEKRVEINNEDNNEDWDDFVPELVPNPSAIDNIFLNNFFNSLSDELYINYNNNYNNNNNNNNNID
jgi:hypothetical protein